MRGTIAMAWVLLATAARAAVAQQPPAWRFHYPEPSAESVRVARDVTTATLLYCEEDDFACVIPTNPYL